MNGLMIFYYEDNEVETFEHNGRILFNPYHVGKCLEIGESGIRNHLANMNENQAVTLYNSDVLLKDTRKLNNTGEKFLTESGVYKLVFKSRKPGAEKFTDWIADEVLPAIRKTGGYGNLITETNYHATQRLGEVVGLARLTATLMKDQKSRPHEITKTVVELLNRFGIEMPGTMLLPNYRDGEAVYDDSIADFMAHAKEGDIIGMAIESVHFNYKEFCRENGYRARGKWPMAHQIRRYLNCGLESVHKVSKTYNVFV